MIIRGSKGIEQYAILDQPDLLGKKVLVTFYDDQYSPGSNANRYPVPQMVLTQDYLDPNSQNLIKTMKTQSNYSRGFREVAGWILYTAKGTYASDPVTSNDSFAIANAKVYDAFQQALSRARSSEGSTVKFEDIELYHTHKERGEAFSFGDLDFQIRHYQSTIQKFLIPGGNFSSYAVPTSGRNLFRNKIQSK